MKPTKKTTIPKKRNRAQPPLDLASSEDESGSQLQDLMDALATIATCLSLWTRILIIVKIGRKLTKLQTEVALFLNIVSNFP